MAEEEAVFDPSLKKKKKSKSKPAFAVDDDAVPTADTTTTSSAGDVEAVTDMVASLSTKKKKKSKSSKEDGDSAPADDAADGPGGEGSAAFDAKKKKKKKKAAAADFDALLEEAGVDEQSKASPSPSAEDASSSSPSAVPKASSVNERGEVDFTYEELLSRFFKILSANNPDLASDRTGQKHKVPPPEVKRDGKKTLFVNIKDISDRLHRPIEHVISFLYAELGTTGSVDGSNRLVIKGRFQQKQLETVLRKYILEYVTCKTCKAINTKLRKENRLFFLDCNSCGSVRSVSSIKTGYQAIIKRPRN